MAPSLQGVYFIIQGCHMAVHDGQLCLHLGLFVFQSFLVWFGLGWCFWFGLV